MTNREKQQRNASIRRTMRYAAAAGLAAAMTVLVPVAGTGPLGESSGVRAQIGPGQLFIPVMPGMGICIHLPCTGPWCCTDFEPPDSRI